MVLEETDSNEARVAVKSYFEKGYSVYTVDFALTEALNVVWKHGKIFKDLDEEKVNSTVQDLVKLYDGLNIVLAREIAAESIKTALRQDMSAYVALFVTATEKLNGTLFTSDQKLQKNANQVSIKLLKK